MGAETSTSLSAAFVNVFCAGGWCWCTHKPRAENVSNHAQVLDAHAFKLFKSSYCVNVSVPETGGVCTQKSRTEAVVTDLIFDGCLLHLFTHFSCCTQCAEKATPFGAFVDACCKACAFANTFLHVLLCDTYAFVERRHIWIAHYMRMWMQMQLLVQMLDGF